MASTRLFSTGILRLGAPGNTALTSTDVIGSIQDIKVSDTFSRDEAYEAAQVAVYPQDAADSEGHFKISFSSEDINAKMLPYTTGATSRSVTVSDVAKTEYAIGGTDVPTFARAEFVTVDRLGKNWQFIGTLVKASGFDLSLQRKGFGKQQYEVEFYPDPNATSPNDATATAAAAAFITKDV